MSTIDGVLRHSAQPHGEHSHVEVAQLWGDSLVGLAHFSPAQSVVLGETPGCSFSVPAELLPRDEFPLVVHRYGQPFVRIARGQRGAVERNGESLPLAAWLARGAADAGGDAEIPLGEGERVRIEIAPGLVLLVQRVERSAPIAARSLDETDRRFLGVFASLTIGLALVGSLLKLLAMIGLFAPAPTAIDDLTRTADLVAIFQRPEPVATPLPKRRGADPDAGTPDAGAGAKLTGDAGKIGRPDALHEKTKGSPTKTRTDREVVKGSGVLGALASSGIDLPALFGTGPLAAGIDDTLGGLEGPNYADQRGPGGFALAGDERGGGGESLTIPGFGPRGRVRGGVDGFGDKPGRRGKKPDAVIGIDEGETIVTVGLDPALIQAVIERHLPALQTCYERQLARNATLGGKVLIRFTIAGDGFVSAAAADAASTLTDENVHQCMLRRFRSMRFPAPPGGGTVGVKYPFLFKTAGR